MASQSVLLIVGADRALAARARALLAPHGWACACEAQIERALDRLARSPPAAVLVDARTADAEAATAAIRSLPAPLNGTPILTAGESPPSAAPARRVAPSLPDEAFLGLLRHWGGPLDDHALRREPWSFRYRLIRLLGLDAADAMLDRLSAALQDALASAAAGGAVPAHRLAGIAGLCGFADLARLWSGVDRGEDGALAAALAQSRKAVAQIERHAGGGGGRDG